MNTKSNMNSKSEPTSLKKFLVLWNNSDRDNSEQVLNPDFMTPDKIMSKQHGEMNHAIASVSDQIQTTPTLLTEFGTNSTIVSFANGNPGSIHIGISRDINVSKFAKPHNTIAKLQKTITSSSSPMEEFEESPKPFQIVSGLLARNFAVTLKMIA